MVKLVFGCGRDVNSDPLEVRKLHQTLDKWPTCGTTSCIDMFYRTERLNNKNLSEVGNA